MEASVCWALAAGLREWKEMRRGGEREAERERVRERERDTAPPHFTRGGEHEYGLQVA